MSMRDASNAITICEVLRRINDLNQGDSKREKMTRKLLAEAERMAKKMSLKLLEYNKEVFTNYWEENKNKEEDLKKRMSKNYLTGE